MATQLTSQMRKILKRMEAGAYIREARDTFMEKSEWWLQDDTAIYAQVTARTMDKLFRSGLIEQWYIEVTRQGTPTNEELLCLRGRLPLAFAHLSLSGDEPVVFDPQKVATAG